MVTTRSQAAKRTRFTSLPLEILQTIFGYFCLHCREKHHPPSKSPTTDLRATSQYPDSPVWYSLERHTLFTLCLVSRSFCYAAQPVLYHEFMPGYGDSWRSNLYSWDGRLTSFMRTVARRLDLAALVKRIYVHPSLVGVYFQVPLGGHVEKEARDVLQLTGLGLRIEEPELLSANDLVTLLIALLPRLQHCSLQVDDKSHKIVRPVGLRAAGISRLPLKTIDFSQQARSIFSQRYSLEWCAGALLEVSTSLVTLNLHACGGTWNRHSVPFPSLPNLKTIRLTSSRIDEESLDALLSSCSYLRVFNYEAGRRRIEGEPGVEFDPNYPWHESHFQLSNAVKYLEYHRTTLNSIHLDLRWRGNLIPYLYPARGVFTFQEFTQLEHLFLNLDEFHSLFWDVSPAEDHQLLVQLVPSSIVSLHLAGHIKNELPRLEKALLNLAEAASSGKFPSLKEIRWDKDEKLSCEDAVITMFAAAGVSFCYDSWPTTQSVLDDGHVWPPANHPACNTWYQLDVDL